MMLIPQLRKALHAHNFLPITDDKTAQQLFLHLPAINIQIKDLNLALCAKELPLQRISHGT